MKKIYLTILIMITSILLPLKSFATGLPVFDIGEIAKTIELINKAKDQLAELKDLSKVNKEQLNFLQQNTNGNYGYGKLLNTTTDVNRRKWSNDSWIDVLNKASNSRTSGFANAQSNYEKLYPVSKPEAIGRTQLNGGLSRTYYQQSSQISRAALATSSYGYDQVNQHIENLHNILAKLDNETTEKAAIDLNARLVAELGFIQLELLRQQTIQNQLVATQTQGEVNGMSDQAKFMQWNPQ